MNEPKGACTDQGWGGNEMTIHPKDVQLVAVPGYEWKLLPPVYPLDGPDKLRVIVTKGRESTHWILVKKEPTVWEKFCDLPDGTLVEAIDKDGKHYAGFIGSIGPGYRPLYGDTFFSHAQSSSFTEKLLHSFYVLERKEK